MANAVRVRPNHYETLGLTPAATAAEIAAAFAREISPYRPRAFGGIAQVSIAYETLRDPVKRRAYDASLGLNGEPKPPISRAAAPALRGAWVIAPPTAAKKQAHYVPPHSPAIEPDARWEPPPVPRPEPVSSFAPRDPLQSAVSEPSRAPRPQAPSRPRPQDAAGPAVEQRIEDFLAKRRSGTDRSAGPGEIASEWRRPELAVGALIGAVALIGALAGWWAASDVEAEPAETVASIVPPDTQARPPGRVAAPEVRPGARETAPGLAAPAAGTPPRSRRAPVAQAKPGTPAERRIAEEEFAGDAVQAGELDDIVVQRADADAPPGPAVASTLPLPNKVVARTIERIGYSCGEVASTTPVEGAAPGVFKVTCTSGQSYRAAPTRGRYHFRRWERL